jgi:hypothetical protein
MCRKRACLALCWCVLALAPAAFGQTADEWKAAKSELSELAKQGKCSESWDLIWRWAKIGNSEARTMVGMAIYFDTLSPPGLSYDAATIRRHKYTFIVHALLNVDPATADPPVLEVREDFLKQKSLTGGNPHPFYDCLQEADRRACTAELVRTRFVADFDNYANELDAVAKLPGAKPATCPSLHGVHRQR